MVNDIYNRINPVLWDFERLKYPEQPPLPILGERYQDKRLRQHPKQYELSFKNRFLKYSKEHKFNDNYAAEYGAYAIRNQRNDEEMNSEESKDQGSEVSSEIMENGRNRPLYYDPHNDEFDRDSDEDFIVDLHSGEGVRRRLRRTNDNPPAHENHNANEENKNSERRQRYERNRRIRDRNRRRGEEDDDESEDMEDYAIQDLIEDEESEEDSIMKLEGSSRITRNRNNDNSSHDPPFPDEISEERKDEAESISSTKSTPLVIPSSSRIISEDDKDEDLIKPTGFYVSQNNEENYQLENSEMKDGYQIDIEEAIKMKDEDKSALDCGLCKKKRGEFSLIGPFKYFLNNKATDEMVYWFHRECLERNDIVKQISKYEFDNIQE